MIVSVDRSVRARRAEPRGAETGRAGRAWKLLYGLLLFSGNDNALTLAIAAGGTTLAFHRTDEREGTGARTEEHALPSPSGLIDKGNYSTAWDMAALARYAMWNPRFRAVVRTHIKRVPWSAPTYAKVYVNKNQLIGAYPGADGVKTGWTTIGRHCLVASVTRHGVSLIAVVLGADDSYADVKKLFAYGLKAES